MFVQVLRLAQAAGLVRLGTIAVDGTKIQGNASRHKAMSSGYMTKEVVRIRAEIEVLRKQAETVDAQDDAVLGARRGEELPEELRRREDRWATIEAAMKRLEAEAQAAAAAEKPRREEADAERQRTGTKRRGREPGPIVETPADKAQTNFTAPELSIMATANKGWESCGNAQASVDGACQIIVACEVTDQCHDKQQAAPMAEATRAPLDAAGIATAADASGARPQIPAVLDTGYFSAAAVGAMEREGFDPHIATERQRHHQTLPAAADEPAVSPATPKEKMRAKLGTESGRELYARRKTIVEPVFGPIKEARGFRRFLLRGLAKIRGEWRLVSRNRVTEAATRRSALPPVRGPHGRHHVEPLPLGPLDPGLPCLRADAELACDGLRGLLAALDGGRRQRWPDGAGHRDRLVPDALERALLDVAGVFSLLHADCERMELAHG